MVLDEFINTISSIDSTMLREMRSTLMSLGDYHLGVPGAWFIPSYSDNHDHLDKLENYANLLTYFGNHNALSGSRSQETWYGENGAPRKWYRQSLT